MAHAVRNLLVLSCLFGATFAGAQETPSPTWPDLLADAGPQGGGEKDAALIVGVGDYIYLPPIAGAAENAAAWQQWLLRSRKLRPDHVVMLTSREATREKITKNLKALAAEMAPEGTLWFVFIGHGAPSPSGNDGVLLGADTDADADSIAGRGVPQNEVLAIINAGQQAHSVMIFDACFSGRTGDGSKVLVEGLQATLPVRPAAAAATRATVLSASDSFAGPLPGAGRPAFSYLMLGALRGWADDDDNHAVDVDEAFAFTHRTIQALFKGADRLPVRSGPGLVLARNVGESKPDLVALVSGRCPPETRWDGRLCKALPKVTCPAGTSWNGTACASDCPSGTVWSEGSCVAQAVKCPEGTSWDGAACGVTMAAALPVGAGATTATTAAATPTTLVSPSVERDPWRPVWAGAAAAAGSTAVVLGANALASTLTVDSTGALLGFAFASGALSGVVGGLAAWPLTGTPWSVVDGAAGATVITTVGVAMMAPLFFSLDTSAQGLGIAGSYVALMGPPVGATLTVALVDATRDE